MIPILALIALVAIAVAPLVWPGIADRSRRFELPYIVVVMLSIIVWRLPSIVIDHEINVDESQTIAQCMAFHHDPMPWRSADTTTSGPLNTYVYMWPYLFGVTPSYATLRWTSVFMIGATIFFLRRFAAAVIAPSLAYASLIPLLLHWSLNTNPDFMHASTELLPTSLMAGAVCLLPLIWRRTATAWQMCACGLLLGMAAIAKMQASLPAATLLCVLAARAASPLTAAALRSSAALLIGGVLPIATLTATVFAGGVLDQMINRYFVALGGLTVPLDQPIGWPERLLVILGSGSLYGQYCLWLIGIVAAAAITRFRRRSKWSGEQIAVDGSLCVFAVSTLYAILRSGALSPHYATLTVVPLFLVQTAALNALTQAATKRNRRAGLCLIVIAVVLPALEVAPSMEKRSDLLRAALAGDTRGELGRYLAAHTPPNETLAIWGWTPRYFVEAQRRSGTRDLVSWFLLAQHPLRDWYRRIYHADLVRNRPYFFLDTATDFTPNAAFPPLTERRHTSDPVIAQFVARHYELVAKVTPEGYEVPFLLYRRLSAARSAVGDAPARIRSSDTEADSFRGE